MVPLDMPVMIPPLLPIVATVVLLLLHVPPDVEFESKVVDATHKDESPVIFVGKGLTVSDIVLAHPVGNV